MNILLSNQKQIIEQAKFTYSLLRKSSQKTKKNKKIEDQRKNQVDILKTSKPKDLETIKGK